MALASMEWDPDRTQRWTRTLWTANGGIDYYEYFTSYVKNQPQMDSGSECESRRKKDSKDKITFITMCS